MSPANDAPWSHLLRRNPWRGPRTSRALWFSLFLLLVAALHTFHRHLGPKALVLSTLSLGAAWIVSIVLHELGHAVAARLANLTPFILVVGGGPRLFLGRALGMAVDIGLLPGSGLTLCASRGPRAGMKWRLLSMCAGGPLASVVLLAFAFRAFPESWNALLTGTDDWIGPGAALVLANLLVLVSTAIPAARSGPGVLPHGDLIQILRLPWLEPRVVNESLDMAGAMGFRQLLVLGRHQAAFEEARRVLDADPDQWTLRYQLADMLIHARRYPEAAAEYARVLQAPTLLHRNDLKLAAAIAFNNHAWARYMMGGAENLTLADRSSRKAIGLGPENPHVLGTRGAVLVAVGKVKKGRRLLETALRKHRDGGARALNLAGLSMVSARTGRVPEARSLLVDARRLDRHCVLLERAEGELRKVAGIPWGGTPGPTDR